MAEGQPAAAPARMWPVWAWPALALGVVYRPLGAITRRDILLLERLDQPWARWTPFLAIALTVVFSLLRLGITDVYTESLVFMGLALALGLASPAAGVLIVLSHAVFDLIVSVPQLGAFGASPLEMLGGIAGRLVSYWLLWLLVVAVPIVVRTVPGAVMESGTPRDMGQRRLAAAASATVVAGLLIFIWTQAAPMLVRPVFTWSYHGQPTYAAIGPIQEQGVVLIILGVLAAGATAFARFRLWPPPAADPGEGLQAVAADDLQDLELEEFEEEADPEPTNWLGQLVGHVLLVVALGGLITGAIDVAILFAAALVARPLAQRGLTATPLPALLARIPWIVRFLVAFGVTYLIGLFVTALLLGPGLGSEFLPIVITVAAGMVVFEILTAAETRAAEPRAPAGATTAAALVVGVVGLGALSLAFPAVALADNMSGWGDAGFGANAAAAAAAGAGAAAAAAAAKGRGRGTRGGGRGGSRRGPGGTPPAPPPDRVPDDMITPLVPPEPEPVPDDMITPLVPPEPEPVPDDMIVPLVPPEPEPVPDDMIVPLVPPQKDADRRPRHPRRPKKRLADRVQDAFRRPPGEPRYGPWP